MLDRRVTVQLRRAPLDAAGARLRPAARAHVGADAVGRAFALELDRLGYRVAGNPVAARHLPAPRNRVDVERARIRFSDELQKSRERRLGFGGGADRLAADSQGTEMYRSIGSIRC